MRPPRVLSGGELGSAAMANASAITSIQAAPPPQRDLLQGPILPTLVRLSLPNAAATAATVLVSVVETAYVGRLGTAALAGIAVVFPIIVVQNSFSNGAMGGGVSAAISRALGAHDEERARALAVHAALIGVVAGLLTTTLMLLLGPGIYRLLGATGGALDEAIAYSNLAFLASIPVWLTGMFISIVRGTGDMRLPSWVTIGLVLVQAVLGGILGLGFGPIPGFGMPGVAVGFVIAFCGAAVFLLWHLSSRYARVPLVLSGIVLRRELFSEILGVGLLSCISPLQTTMTVMVVTALVAPLGAVALAGYGIGARLEMVLAPIAFGIGVACVPMVGIAIGAGDVRRARRVAAIGAVLAGTILGLIGVVVVVAPQLWAGIFTDNVEALAVAHLFLILSGPAYAFFGVGLCLLFASQGAGKVLGPVLAGTTRLAAMAFGGWCLAATDAPLWTYFALVAAGMAIYGTFAGTAVYLSDWRAKPAALS